MEGIDPGIKAVIVESLDESSSDSSFLYESTSSASISSSSDSDEESSTKKARIQAYLLIIPKYTDLQFKQHFRLSRVVAERVIEHYRATFSELKEHGGRSKVGPDAEIYITLWFLANTETYRQLSDRFNVTRSSIHRILYRVIKWMVKESHHYIKWPTPLEMKTNQIQFVMMKGVPRVVGAIDGSHIRINPPKTDKDAYYNRKKYYSLLLQGIVNAEKMFIDVHCGEPGSMHDARLLRKSTFYRRISEDPSVIIPGGVLLGDSAYAESSYLVTPYKDFGNLNAKQLKFNYLHSATQIVVENAFGLLKSRFRMLKFVESPNLGFITNCIVAACVLHNICIAENDYCEIEYLDDYQVPMPAETQLECNSSTGVRQEIFDNMDNNGLLD